MFDDKYSPWFGFGARALWFAQDWPIFFTILLEYSYIWIQDNLNVHMCCRLSCVVLGRSLVPAGMVLSVNLLTAWMS